MRPVGEVSADRCVGIRSETGGGSVSRQMSGDKK